jgi:hypothetical protein
MRFIARAAAIALLAVMGVALFAPLSTPADRAGVVRAAGAGLLPDLQTVVPLHLGITNSHQREVLRFSNGIANTGDGPWRMRPVFPLSGSAGTQDAVQDVLDADGAVVDSEVVSQFEFHPEHNHWHISGVALFEVRAGAVDGPVFGDNSVKTTFCLIDWYALEGNSNTSDRTYWDCNGELQGISPGWVDQYHQSLVGQNLDITGAPAGRYYLVSTANPDGNFLEADLSNNTAWVAFDLTRDSKGNAKLAVSGHSDCEGPMCGDKAPNR